MQDKTLDRRILLLQMEGQGLFPVEIVRAVSKQFGCSERTIYRDMETRKGWQPQLMAMEHALLRILNRHDQLFRKAVFQYGQSVDVRDKATFLNIMRQINLDVYNFLAHAGLTDHIAGEIIEKVGKEDDLNTILRDYDGIIKSATRSNLQADSPSEQVHPEGTPTPQT